MPKMEKRNVNELNRIIERKNKPGISAYFIADE